MPQVFKIQASNNKWYEIGSILQDTVEETTPELFFVTNMYFLLIHLRGYTKHIAKELSIMELLKWELKPCPDFLQALYKTNRKKDQERLLRGKTITTENYICWILLGGRNGGLLSQYTYDDGAQDNLQGKVPPLIDISDSKNIVTYGKTDLPDDTLRHAVEYHKTVLAHFVYFSEERWYCFYRTHRGLAGRKSGNQGQHFHFISSVYGIKKEILSNNFRKGKCPSNGCHVRIIVDRITQQTKDLFINTK